MRDFGKWITRAIAVPGLILMTAGAMPAVAGEVFTTHGVAIHGYDPVSYFTDGHPVEGKAKITAEWHGATFRFASEEHRRAFKADPNHYAPQYGGYCAYAVAKGQKASTQPQAFTIVDDKLYLNYNDDVMKTWRGDVPGYVTKANSNWSEVVATPDPKG